MTIRLYTTHDKPTTICLGTGRNEMPPSEFLSYFLYDIMRFNDLMQKDLYEGVAHPISRTSIECFLNGNGNPRLRTLVALFDNLGVRIDIHAPY